ncbi:MAG: Gfo/Idh/MocA family oxidoreductase [Kiritimatiellae bacterium]|nr:Gfo/Idh/MocA family oxidoreductase [Kiritimatiellia bacterium]
MRTTAGACATASGGCLGLARGGAHRKDAVERLKVAVIGVGGYGQANVRAVCGAGEELVALCDVDESELLAGREQVARQYPAVRLYKDFRVLLDAEKGVDAVFIATPDHGHAMQAAWAMARGCHVYIEPPLARTLREVRVLRKQARQHNVTVQLGNQGSAKAEFRRALEVLTAGVIGEVGEIHVWTNRPVWPQGINRPDGCDPVPAGLDWDLWLGGAPARPFKNKVYHRFNWRGWHDFGTGTLGDAGSHLLNLPFRALALGAPVAVEADGTTERFAETYAKASTVRFEFAPHKRKTRLTAVWYDGDRKPEPEVMPQVTAAFGRIPDAGCLLVGAKGVWFVSDESGTRHYLAVQGEERVRDFEKHEACEAAPLVFPRVKSQQQEFLDAVRCGTRSFSDMSHAAPLTETVLAGCAAQRVPGRLEWNSRKGRFMNSVEAGRLVAPGYRRGWSVENIGK